MEKAMEEGKEEFTELTLKLIDVMVNFCVRALKTAKASKGDVLTPLQVEKMISHEIKNVLKQISNPKFTYVVAKKAKLKYAKIKVNG